jgi:hypothetical protein
MRVRVSPGVIGRDMKVLNTRPDGYLVKCIKTDLYNILHKAQPPKPIGFSVSYEVSKLLDKYKMSGFIKDFNIVFVGIWSICVCIYTPKKTTIHCRIP